jgi:hypothetical protein
LLPSEGEVWLTRGLIEARLGQVRPCELSVAKAEELGVTWPRCSLQRAWAYLKSRPVQFGLAEKELARLRSYVESNMRDSRVQRELGLIEGRLLSLKTRKKKNETDL